MQHNHNKPDNTTPAYKHPDLTSIEPWLKLLLDVYNGLENCKGDYLTKYEKEPDRAYQSRVSNATFNNYLRPTVESNAGLLTAFELDGTPASFDPDNVDGRGTSYKSFFKEADELSLRDGLCYILTDYPEVDESLETLADLMEADRKPYWRLIDRRNLLNWRYHYEFGKLIVDQVTFKTVEESSDGMFGVKSSDRYHVFKRSKQGEVTYQAFEIKQQQGKDTVVPLNAPVTLTVPEIPIISYPRTSKPFCTDPPQFLKLARLNLKLFRKESNLDEIEFRVNVPTVTRTHPGDVPENPPPIVLGSSWVIEIPQGGQVDVLEISGSGMADLRGSIAELKATIEAESQAFIGGSRVERTATEAYLDSSQSQATLQGYAREKIGAIKKLFGVWAAYTGESTDGLVVSEDHSLLEQPLDSGEVGVLTALWEKGGISHLTLLRLLKMGKQLPPDFEPENELELIDEEAAKQEMIPQPAIAELAQMPPTAI